MHSLPLYVQKALALVNELGSGNSDLIIHEEVLLTPDEIPKEIFQKMEKNSLRHKS
jgi:hypothetical protein